LNVLELSKKEKKRFREKARREFPGDEMMQELHYIRLVHHHQTKGFSVREKVRFYGHEE